MPKEAILSNQKFAKILLSITVACMVLLCAGMFLAPLVDGGDCYADMLYGLIVIPLTSMACMFLAVKCDKRNKIIVKTQGLPWMVLFGGAIISVFSFGTMLQTEHLISVSQAFRLFTIAVLACAVVLSPLLWLTTEPEKLKPTDKKPGLVLLK